MFVVDVELSVRSMKTQEQVQQPDVYGRFPCTFPGCPKSFAHHGQLKKDHEAQHNPPVPVSSTDTHILRSTGVHPWKMMTCCLTREHSFMYMYLKHQGGSSNKYSLEAHCICRFKFMHCLVHSQPTI